MSDINPDGFMRLRLPSGLRNAAEARAAAKALAAQQWQCDESEFELLFKPSVWLGEEVWVKAVEPAAFEAHRAAAQRHSRRILAWGLGVSVLILLAAAGLLWHGHKQQLEQLEKLQHVQDKLKVRQAQERERQAWVDAQAEQHKWLRPRLELDLNPVFDAIESVQLPQVRLRTLEIDAASQTAHLGYELTNMAQFQALNEALTSEKIQLRCQLSGGQSLNQNITGQWTCKF